MTAQQAPASPTLPQNDTPQVQAQRKAQLASAQTTYSWTSDVQTLPGIPVVKGLPSEEEPNLEWGLKLVGILLKLVVNVLAVQKQVHAQQGDAIAQEAIDAGEKLAAAVAADVAAIQAKFDAHTGNCPKGGLIEHLAEEFVEDRLVEALKGHVATLKGLLNTQGKVNAALAAASPPQIADYRALFDTISCPGVSWQLLDDLEFARLRIAGPNCMLIETVTAIPSGCPLTDTQYASLVANDTLSGALAAGRIFQCDYKDLSVIAPEAGGGKYLYMPIALFALPPGSQELVPIAIRCDPSDASCPVVMPSLVVEEQWGWQMAKFIVQVADGNYHELVAHLARTHLVTEAIAVATHRQLANLHPVWALLLPHFEGTMFINNAAATSLITAGGPIDEIFAGTITSSQAQAAAARLSFNFTDKMLPNDLAARGFGPSSPLTNYPYAVDGMQVWAAIGNWVFNYLSLYYDGDAAVQGDYELAAWAEEISGIGKVTGFPKPQTFLELAEVCTMIIFTASAQHAAVNFPQKAVMEFAPAVTGALWQPLPTTFRGKGKSDWLDLMPTLDIALEQLKVLYLLGSLYFRPLGDYKSPDAPYPAWFLDPNVSGPLANFQGALAGVEAAIDAENTTRRVPYPFLKPSLIPSSTNI